MQYSTLFLAALSASSALAAPLDIAVDNSDIDIGIIVTLTNKQDASIRASQGFTEGAGVQKLEKAPVGSSGPFNFVELDIGKDVKNQDLRCELVQRTGARVIVTRDDAVDVTFGRVTPQKGGWNFANTDIIDIICDPAFKKGAAGVSPFQSIPNIPAPPAASAVSSAPAATATAKTFSNSDPTGIQVTLDDLQETTVNVQFKNQGARETERVFGTNGPFKNVTLSIGEKINNALRCEALDSNNQPLVIKRGDNIEHSFSDASKGAWGFYDQVNHKFIEAYVSNVLCDNTIVKDA